MRSKYITSFWNKENFLGLSFSFVPPRRQGEDSILIPNGLLQFKIIPLELYIAPTSVKRLNRNWNIIAIYPWHLKYVLTLAPLWDISNAIMCSNNVTIFEYEIEEIIIFGQTKKKGSSYTKQNYNVTLNVTLKQT